MTCSFDLPMLGLDVKDNHLTAVAIPAGQTVEVIGRPKGSRLVIVSVNDEQLVVFASDLANRGVKIKSIGKVRSVCVNA
jgi:hypothetical protein